MKYQPVSQPLVLSEIPAVTNAILKECVKAKEEQKKEEKEEKGANDPNMDKDDTLDNLDKKYGVA